MRLKGEQTMQLGQTIKNIRKQNNLTQEKFAEIFNVTRQTVSNWENEKSYPDLLTLVQISDSFDISLDKMLKEDMKMTKKLDSEIKCAKYIKNIFGAVIGIVIAVAIIWFFIWNSSKKEVESKFTSGLENYEYTVDETVSKGGYYIISYNDDTYFGIPHQKMPDYFDFRADFHAKSIHCYTKLDGEKIHLIWSGYDKNSDEMRIGVDELNSSEKSKTDDEIKNNDDLKDIIEYGTTLYNSLYK